MISMTTISSAGGISKYMTQQAAAEYYAGEKVPSQWEGKGAELQGLVGEVSADDLTKQLEGKVWEANKETGVLQEKRLGAMREGELQHRAGWDMTFAASKSVSIESEVFAKEDVRAAHEAAVREAMAFLESKTAQARINGETVITGNLTYATFSHATSRAGDSQTHTHVLIANVTYDKDGKAYSLSNEKLMEFRHAADQVYKNALANSLEKLGYQIQWNNKGDFEIVGYSREQVEVFSKRTEQMNEALRAQGIDPEHASNAARQAAVLNSRADKDRPESADAHRERWQAEAEANGIQAAERNGIGIYEAVSADKAVSQAVAHLTEREMAFKECELYLEAAKFCQGRATNDDLFKAIDAAKATGELIERTDGKYTTKDAVKCEKEIVQQLNEGRGAHEAVMSESEFYKALEPFEKRIGFKLTSEQREAAKMILCGDDRFQGVQGLAGTGKTTMLKFVSEAAEIKGWEVHGMSNGGAQAYKLEVESNIKSQTTASFVIDFKKMERDAILSRRSLDTYSKRGLLFGEPDFKQLMSEVKAGNVFFDRDSQGRSYFTDRAGNTYCKELFGKAGELESGNVFHFGLTSSTYYLTDKGVFKSGGTPISELASKLHEKTSLGSWANKATSSMMNWQKANPAEALIVREMIVNKTHSELKSQALALTTQPQKILYIGDEASMSGARETRDVITATIMTGARHVALGDKFQHQSVASGGKTFELAQSHMPMSYLGADSVRRQTTEHAKGTVSKVLADKHKEATAGLPTIEFSNQQDEVKAKFAKKDITGRDKVAYQGALKEAERADNINVISAIANNYSSLDRSERNKTLIISTTNADRKRINNEVRDNLKAQGELQNGKTMITLEPSKLSETELKLASNYEKGQKVEFTSNYKNIGIEKGVLVTVTGTDSRTNTVIAKTESGKEIKFNPEKVQGRELSNENKGKEFAVGDRITFAKNDRDLDVRKGQIGTVEKFDGKFMMVRLDNGQSREFKVDLYKHVDHAYAMTSFKSQGQTIENVMVHHNTAGGKHGDRETYVNYTRAKENITVYTQNKELAVHQSGAKLDKEAASKSAQIGDKVSFVESDKKTLGVEKVQTGMIAGIEKTTDGLPSNVSITMENGEQRSFSLDQMHDTKAISDVSEKLSTDKQAGSMQMVHDNVPDRHEQQNSTAQADKPQEQSNEGTRYDSFSHGLVDGLALAVAGTVYDSVKNTQAEKPQEQSNEGTRYDSFSHGLVDGLALAVAGTVYDSVKNSQAEKLQSPAEKHGIAPEGTKILISKTDNYLGVKAGDKATVSRVTDKTVEIKLESGGTRALSISQYKAATSRAEQSNANNHSVKENASSSRSSGYGRGR